MSDLHASLTWAGLQVGDRIRIKGQRGEFAFCQYVTNTSNGEEWIDVWDTKKGRLRSFRTSVPWRKVKRRPPDGQ